MALTQINIIGCGRLGKTLGALLQKSQAATIKGIVNASFESALKAVQFIGQGEAYQGIEELPAADLYLIATPDDLIQSKSEELLKNKHVNGKILIHCSGSLCSEILQAAKHENCLIASIHPLKSFAKPQEAVHTFAGTYCALEGDGAALPFLTDLFAKIGARVFQINPQQKSFYHAASVMANNYLVSLYHHALLSYQTAGIDKTIAQALTFSLMTETLDNLKRLTPAEALTGPLQRGDAGTIEKHLQTLEALPATRALYIALAEATLPLTPHSEKKQEILKATLSTPI